MLGPSALFLSTSIEMKAHATSGLDPLPTRFNARPMNQGSSHTGDSGLSGSLVFDGLFGRA